MRSVFALAALAASLLAGTALAATIEVQGAWIRTPPPGAPTAAGYATIVNHGALADRLVGGRTSVAADVQPHKMVTDRGVMRMRPFPGGLPIGPGASARFDPGGDHLMLTGLRRPLRAGQHVRIVLRFSHAGAVATDFVVRDGPGM